jgi:2-keto-myo-inositol isomerase
MPATLRFALNRMSAPRLPLDNFLALARALGMDAVEIRNDLAGVEITDGTSATALAEAARRHGLRLRSINALQRFEQYDAERDAEARALLRYAADSGTEALVLCPTNSRRDARSAEQRHADLVHALRQLQPLLREHGITGLVEPLGFEECALRRKSQAVRAIEEVDGAAEFALVHDTFHHHLAGEAQMFPARTGLVHVSGVEDSTLATASLRDGHRVLVGPADRLGNAAQLQALRAGGYTGYVSFEPFAEEIAQAEDIAARLRASMDYLSTALPTSGGA